MHLKSSTERLIMAMLLISFIGFLTVSACSSSHGQFSHDHHSHDHQLAGHHDGGHHHDDDDDDADATPDGSGHVHRHNPLDHTHDIPLHMTLSTSPQPRVFREWQALSPLPPYSTSLIPLERPPKSA